MTAYRRWATGVAVFALAGYSFAQRGMGPAGPPIAAERTNYEAKGDFDFLNHCAICHGRNERAASLTTLQSLSPEKIYEAMNTGSMKTQAATLRAAESGDAKKMSNVCALIRRSGRRERQLPGTDGAPIR